MIDDDDFDYDAPVTRIAAHKNEAQQAGKIILEDAQQYLDTMTAGEHSFLQKHLAKLAHEEGYFQVLAEALDQPEGSKIANDALNVLYFWQLVNDADDIAQFDLLAVPTGEFFQTELFKALDDMQVDVHQVQRRNIIEQALKLYAQGIYAGCIPILYAQLEGLLTDVLVAKGFLEQKDTKFLDVHKIVPGLKGNEIKSLWHKSKIAFEMNSYFAELAAYKMDSSSTVTSTRHNMLHGTELAHFTQGRSFVLFLWLFSVISFMRGIKP